MFYQLSWTGDKALKELQEANISLQKFPILHQCAKKVLIIINAQFDDSSTAGWHHSFIALGHFCGYNRSICDGCIALKAIRLASDAEPDVSHLTGMASTLLEGNPSQITYFSQIYGSGILLLTGLVIMQGCSLH